MKLKPSANASHGFHPTCSGRLVTRETKQEHMHFSFLRDQRFGSRDPHIKRHKQAKHMLSTRTSTSLDASVPTVKSHFGRPIPFLFVSRCLPALQVWSKHKPRSTTPVPASHRQFCYETKSESKRKPVPSQPPFNTFCCIAPHARRSPSHPCSASPMAPQHSERAEGKQTDG